MPERLKNQVAIVTSGASGIGRGIARLFVMEGARVVVADKNRKKGKRVADELGAEFAMYIPCDVTQESDIRSCIEKTVDCYGRLDCLVNNAGSPGPMEPIEKLDIEDCRQSIDLLLTSVLMGMKHAVVPMRNLGGGTIVNISSVAGVRASDYALVYSAAKAGVIGATKSAALQLASENIRVNAVAPGGIVSSIFAAMKPGFDEDNQDDLDLLKSFLRTQQPLEVAGEPRDIAEAVLYLASDAARFVTGHTLVVDGGSTVGRAQKLTEQTTTALHTNK